MLGGWKTGTVVKRQVDCRSRLTVNIEIALVLLCARTTHRGCPTDWVTFLQIPPPFLQRHAKQFSRVNAPQARIAARLHSVARVCPAGFAPAVATALAGAGTARRANVPTVVSKVLNA